MKKVKDIMKSNLVSVKPETTLDKALELLLDENINHLPVLDPNEHLVGIVSDRDMRIAMDSPFLGLYPDNMKDRLHNRVIGDIMQCALQMIDENSDVLQAAQQIRKHKVGSLLVLNAEKKLVGILTEKDLVDHLIDLLQS